MCARVNHTDPDPCDSPCLAEKLSAQSIAERFQAVRATTEHLCKPLAVEDFVVQTTADVSPTKWHLAHTTWFFETFLLAQHSADYCPFDPQFTNLFNSYYNAVGPQHARPKRGLLSRPTVQDVFAYRRHVDQHMMALLDRNAFTEQNLPLIELGLHHEQQHQELILTDIKSVLAENVLRAVYGGRSGTASPLRPLEWTTHPGGVHEIGHSPSTPGFAYDNESPQHKVYLEPFQLATRLVTCSEYAAFMDDGGYRRPELWLSDGWALLQREQWNAPLYWRCDDTTWSVFTLAGRRRIEPSEPVTHLSFYEADAYARWAQARLPREQEWEVAARTHPVNGNFLETGHLHPVSASTIEPPCSQFFGDCWEWTASPYTPYPRYAPPNNALAEYNAKFMCNQMILRGGSCVTPRDHIRSTYRNFFPPHARWQFSGVRLAKDL